MIDPCVQMGFILLLAQSKATVPWNPPAAPPGINTEELTQDKQSYLRRPRADCLPQYEERMCSNSTVPIHASCHLSLGRMILGIWNSETGFDQLMLTSDVRQLL